MTGSFMAIDAKQVENDVTDWFKTAKKVGMPELCYTPGNPPLDSPTTHLPFPTTHLLFPTSHLPPHISRLASPPDNQDGCHFH